jgi:hypothetical protein
VKTTAFGSLALAIVLVVPAVPATAATGEVGSSPGVTARYAMKGAPPPVASARRTAVTPLATSFMYGAGFQTAAAQGSFATYTVSRPALASADFHSLAELAVQSADQRQIVEVGWTVDRGLFGDAEPHLFVYHWVNGGQTCYNGCGYVANPGTPQPGLTLQPSTTATFGIQHSVDRWLIMYNSVSIGFFPDSLWGGTFTQAGLTEWFGEVAVSGAAPCTDMGNGQFAASSSAAQISGIGFFGGPAPAIGTFATNPSFYTAATVSSSSMRYGGPGAC